MKSRLAVALAYAALILAGAVLLSLPIASPSGEWRNFSDSFFTAVSASCITGLTVVEPGTDLSLFGQGVLLTLVQIGCVGVMTLGTFLLVVTGRRLSFAGEFSLSNAYGMTGVRGLRSLVVWVVLSMFLFEALGTAALWWQATAGMSSWEERLADGESWYRAYYYSVMSFCHAGFSLDHGSLAVFRNSPIALFVLGAEVVVGGLGFLVLYNLFTIKFWRRNLIRRGRLSLHSRVTLLATALTLFVTIVLFMALEWRNVGAFVDDWTSRAAIVFFQAVTPRTCGFTVLPVESFHPATHFLTDVLMFIGAAPGSAGGGIKITTFVVFVLTLVAICRGSRDTVVFKRAVPEDVVRESVVIVFFYATLVAVTTTLLLVSETGRPGIAPDQLFFEAISAATTTGLSCGETTVSLSGFGRVVIMLAMFLGRIGAISVVLMMGGRSETVAIRYPKEEIIVG